MAIETIQSRVVPVPTAGAIAASAQVSSEEESQRSHGHGMSRNRKPKDETGQPHDQERDQKQPYTREIEDYSTGVVSPPDEKTGSPKKR